MTWDGQYLLDANGNRIGMVYKAGNRYESMMFFRGTLHLGKCSSLRGAKEELEAWWRDVQAVKL